MVMCGDNRYTIVKKVCEICKKTIATYCESDIIDYDAADICTKCYKKISSKPDPNKIDPYVDLYKKKA